MGNPGTNNHGDNYSNLVIALSILSYVALCIRYKIKIDIVTTISLDKVVQGKKTMKSDQLRMHKLALSLSWKN